MTTTRLLSIPQFANATGLSDALARALVMRGDVPSVRVGARRRVSSHWVEKWVNLGNPEIPTAATEITR
jgi:predicted DNA-binding transcriptional regulator AlpA